MKNLAKLALFFSLTFIIVFFGSLFLEFLSSWLAMVREIPVTPRTMKTVTELSWKSLPIAIFISILLSLSYSARRFIPIPVSIIAIMILASLYTGGFAIAINRSENMGFALNTVQPIQSGPGLVLSRSDSSIILLRESSQISGPRMVSFPEQALIYQEIPLGPNYSIIPLPPFPLGTETPYLINNIYIDLNLSTQEFIRRFQDSYLNFAIYALSLILLLASLRYVLDLSHWPLANIFLGALAFRGILSLKVFLNSREINSLLTNFLRDFAPSEYATPLVFFTISILVMLYTFLANLARPKRSQDA